MTFEKLADEFRKMDINDQNSFLNYLLSGQTFVDAWNKEHGINGVSISEYGGVIVWEV